MFNKFLPWILLGIAVFALLGIGIKSCNKVPDVNPYRMEINKLETENKFLERNLKLINDSLKTERIKIDSISKIEKKIELKKNKIITQGNEELKNIYSKSDSATHDVFTRYVTREDSIYKGLLSGYTILPREVN